MINQKKITFVAGVLVAVLALAVAFPVFAWSEPPANPPECSDPTKPGCNPPVNTGGATQSKPGVLGLGELIVTGTTTALNGVSFNANPTAYRIYTSAGNTLGFRSPGYFVWAINQDPTWSGASLRLSSTNGLEALTPVTISGPLSILMANRLELGRGVNKETEAGRIGYGLKTSGALDIVGGGLTVGNRLVKLWDNLSVVGTTTTNNLDVTNNVCVGSGTSRVCSTSLFGTNVVANPGGTGLTPLTTVKIGTTNYSISGGTSSPLPSGTIEGQTLSYSLSSNSWTPTDTLKAFIQGGVKIIQKQAALSLDVAGPSLFNNLLSAQDLRVNNKLNVGSLAAPVTTVDIPSGDLRVNKAIPAGSEEAKTIYLNSTTDDYYISKSANAINVRVPTAFRVISKAPYTANFTQSNLRYFDFEPGTSNAIMVTHGGIANTYTPYDLYIAPNWGLAKSRVVLGYPNTGNIFNTKLCLGGLSDADCRNSWPNGDNRWASTTANDGIYYGYGKVGIANSAPAALLDVGSNTFAGAAYVRVNSANDRAAGVQWASNGTSLWYLYKPNNGSEELRFRNKANDVLTLVQSTGTVLVGTGGLGVDGNTAIKGTNYLKFGDGALAQDAGKIGWHLPGSNSDALDIVGDGTRPNRLVRLWDNLNVFGTTTTNNLTVTGTTNLNLNAFNLCTGGSCNAITNLLGKDKWASTTANNGIYYSLGPTTRVGIGTTTPGSMLDVNGRITTNDILTGQLFIQGGPYNSLTDRILQQPAGLFWQLSSADTFLLTEHDVTTGLRQIVFMPKFVDGSTGTFSQIGTTDRSDLLLNPRWGSANSPVSGKVIIKDTDQLCLGGTDAGSCKSSWSGVAGVWASTTGNTGIYYTVGNVGIGTNAPGSKLEVSSASNGDIIKANVANGYGAISLFSAGTNKLSIGSAFSAGNYGSQTVAGDVSLKANNTNLHFVTGSGNAQTVLYLSSAGKVGVGGNVAPAASLDVKGNIAATGDICTTVSGSSVCLNSSAGLWQTGTTPDSRTAVYANKQVLAIGVASAADIKSSSASLYIPPSGKIAYFSNMGIKVGGIMMNGDNTTNKGQILTTGSLIINPGSFGNVGIGLATGVEPTAKLDVGGKAKILELLVGPSNSSPSGNPLEVNGSGLILGTLGAQKGVFSNGLTLNNLETLNDPRDPQSVLGVTINGKVGRIDLKEDYLYCVEGNSSRLKPGPETVMTTGGCPYVVHSSSPRILDMRCPGNGVYMAISGGVNVGDAASIYESRPIYGGSSVDNSPLINGSTEYGWRVKSNNKDFDTISLVCKKKGSF